MTAAPPSGISQAPGAPADPPSAPSPTSWGGVLGADESVFADALQHAGKPGFATSEFWSTMIAPPLAFVVGTGATWLATHGLAPNSAEAQAILTPIAGTVSAAAAAWAAQMYTKVRGALKQELTKAAAAPKAPTAA